MGLRDTLELLIQVNPDQGIAAVERFKDATEKGMGASEQALGKFHSAGMKLMGAGVAGLGAGTFLSQMASGDQEAEQQLAAAIQQTGGTIDDYKGRIDAAASNMAKFGHTDQEVNGALATLTLSYNDAGKALDQMQLVADLAARKHMSLEEAAQAVAKAHGGAARFLKEFGIEVGKNTDGTKNYDGALTQLAQKLHGQAEASADSFGGKLREVRAEIENQVSAFGQKYGPAIMAGSAAMTAFGGIAAGVSTVIGKLSAAFEAEAVAEGEAEVAGSGMLAVLGPIGLAIAGVVAVTGLAIEMATTNTKATDEYTAAIQKQNGSLEQNVDEVTAKQLADNSAAKSANDAGLSFKTMFTAVRQGTDDFGNYKRAAIEVENSGKSLSAQQDDLAARLKGLGAGTTEYGQQLVSLLQQHKLTAGQVANLSDSIEGLHNGYTDASRTAKDLADATSQVGDATSAADQAEQDFIKSLDEASKAMKAQMDPLFGAIDAVQKTIDTQTKAKDAQDKLNTAIKEHGPLSQEAADAQANLTSANLDAVKAAEGLDVSLKTLESSVLSGTTSVGAATTQLQTWVSQGVITQAQADQVATSFRSVGDRANELDGRHVDISINADAGAAFNALHELDAQLAGIPTYVDLVVGGHAADQGASAGGAHAYDVGGPVNAPRGQAQLAIVHGGEYVLTADEYDAVKNNLSGGRAAVGGGGGHNITVYAGMGADGAVIGQQIVEKIREYERANGKAWRN